MLFHDQQVVTTFYSLLLVNISLLICFLAVHVFFNTKLLLNSKKDIIKMLLDALPHPQLWHLSSILHVKICQSSNRWACKNLSIY